MFKKSEINRPTWNFGMYDTSPKGKNLNFKTSTALVYIVCSGDPLITAREINFSTLN